MTQLLENTLMGGALILAAAGLRALLKGRVHPNGWLALWAVCLARLLTPLPWRSSLSLYALLGRRTEAELPAPIPNISAAVPVPAAPGAALPAPQSQPAGPSPLAVLWAVAAIGSAVWFIAAWLSARRRVLTTIPLEKSDRRYAALPAGTILREGPMKGAPLTFGAFRPTVVLSPGLRSPELDAVLAHEGAHVRRRDNLWHYVMAAALIVHWFNPAVWLMAALLRRDVEMACDRAALRALGEDRRAEYARTLVTLSTQAEGPAFCRSFGQKKAEERIKAIMKFRKVTFAGVVLALAMVLGLTVAFASAPADGQTAAQPSAAGAEIPGVKLVYDAERDLFVDPGTGEPPDEPVWFGAGADRTFADGDVIYYSNELYEKFYLTADEYAAKLEEFRAQLAAAVERGVIGQEEMDCSMADLERYQEQVRSGEVCAYYTVYDEGESPNGAAFSFGFENAEYKGCTGVFRFVLRDENGEKLPYDPSMFRPAVPCVSDDPVSGAGEIETEAGVTIYLCAPEDEAFWLDYDAERGVWVDRETGAEFAVAFDAEGYLDTGIVASQFLED